ncbi:MAG: CAP domain-containing protein [Actinomycetes bacterium]
MQAPATAVTVTTSRASSTALRVLLAAILAAIATLVPITPADASADLEAQFLSAINSERTSRGLAALSSSGDLVSVARQHSRKMADQQNLHHNPSLGSQVSGWKKVGENVGKGPSVSRIHAAFMASSGHKANILDADWTQAGVGVAVDADGRIWVTEVFRLPKGAEPKAEPEPEPAPTAEAKAEPTSAPKAAEPAKATPKAAPKSAPKPAPAVTTAGDTAPAPAPEPEVPVIEVPLPLDRTTQFLAGE